MSSIAKRAKYIARFNDIDREYHATSHHTYPAIHCVLGRGPIYRARYNHNTYFLCTHDTSISHHITPIPQFIARTARTPRYYLPKDLLENGKALNSYSLDFTQSILYVTIMIEIREYLCSDGSSPFADWFNSLDTQAALKVNTYVTRIEAGNTSSLKSIGDGVYECRIDWRPGYRVYLGKDGEKLIILLG